MKVKIHVECARQHTASFKLRPESLGHKAINKFSLRFFIWKTGLSCKALGFGLDYNCNRKIESIFR